MPDLTKVTETRVTYDAAVANELLTDGWTLLELHERRFTLGRLAPVDAP